jgi:hypothetical protein
MYLQVFESILLLSFGTGTLGFGVFTAYFGAGRSRRIGLGLTLLGILALAFFAAFTWSLVPALAGIVAWDPETVTKGLVAVFAATLGGLLALGLFLTSVMQA